MFSNLLSDLKKILLTYEYTSGFIQRLKDGYGVIHTPRRILTHADSYVESIVSLFGDNKSIQTNKIQYIFGKKLTNELLENNFLIENDQKITSVFRIVPVNQFFVFIPFRQFNEPPVYIGADSLTFSRHIQVFNKPSSILDLATGSGYQLFSLPWQSGNTKMIGLDINENAIKTANLNSIINQTPWMEFFDYNVEERLEALNKQFDLIIGNPPIIPTPENDIKTRLQGMIHANGGKDGFAVVRKIIPQITNILSLRGSFQIILCSLGSTTSINIQDELYDLILKNNLKGQLIVIKKIPIELDSYYRGQKDINEYNRWIKFYKEEKASYWYRLILRLEKKQDALSEEVLKIISLIRSDFSKIPNAERITLDSIKSKLIYYLSDTLVQNQQYSKLFKIQNELIQIIENEDPLRKSIREFGLILFNLMPDLFPNPGSAIRFWGQCTNEFWWKPKYFERVMW
jgi:methylase of polypeptide subunit release factors